MLQGNSQDLQMTARGAAIDRWMAWWIVLCMLFIPFPFHILIGQEALTETLFGPLVKWIAGLIAGKQPLLEGFHSDTKSLYILVVLLAIIAAITTLLPVFRQQKFIAIVRIAAAFYLSLMLWKYGLDKVFKHQFYLPEPNLLYTPMGKMDKDILFWSSMGTSRLYNLFTGGVEIIAAVLLLFRRTRFAGALLSVVLMTQVLAINFSFDISVKVYSLLLLIISCWLLAPRFRALYLFLSGQQVPAAPSQYRPVSHPFWYLFLKTFITGILLLEACWPYIRSGNFNDDLAARPPLHGAYEVQQYIRGTDTLAKADFPLKRFFIHRQSYLILQDQQDNMQDLKLVPGSGAGGYDLVNYRNEHLPVDLSYNPADSILTIQMGMETSPVTIAGKSLDWRKLPLLRKLFHWTVD